MHMGDSEQGELFTVEAPAPTAAKRRHDRRSVAPRVRVSAKARIRVVDPGAVRAAAVAGLGRCVFLGDEADRGAASEEARADIEQDLAVALDYAVDPFGGLSNVPGVRLTDVDLIFRPVDDSTLEAKIEAAVVVEDTAELLTAAVAACEDVVGLGPAEAEHRPHEPAKEHVVALSFAADPCACLLELPGVEIVDAAVSFDETSEA